MNRKEREEVFKAINDVAKRVNDVSQKLDEVMQKLNSDSNERITVNKKVSVGNNSSTIETVQDKIFLAAETEIFNSTTNSFAAEGTQYQYYKNATANRYKMPKWNSSSVTHIYWERSPYSGNATHFCSVYISGSADYYGADGAFGVAPCLCI